MTKNDRFKLVAKAALVFGPALAIVSVLCNSGLIELSPELLKLCAPGIVLGALSTVLGMQALRTA